VRWYEAESVAVDEERSGRWVRALGPFLTLGALVLVVVHLIWPHVRIDSITLVLLAVALLPWLSPLFKSIELPGGWKFEFQELKRQVTQDLEDKEQKVQTLADRVDRVESAVFVGDFEPELKDRLTSALDDYHGYLADLEFPNNVEPPTVKIDPSLEMAFYDAAGHEIHIAEATGENINVILRLYTLHVLGSPDQGDWMSWSAVASGLAFYLPCSFHDDPMFGATSPRFREGKQGEEAHALDLRAHGSFDELEIDPATASAVWYLQAGGIWAVTLWDLRGAVGGPATDQAAADAWRATNFAGDKPISIRYARAVVSKLEPSARAVARKIFSARGLHLGKGDQ
jgi:hypothetical protein